MIITDSKTAIKSLMNVYTTSDLVHECRTSLNAMAGHSNIVLQWVRGHRTCNGNIVADNLALRGANLSAEHTDISCDLSLNACKTKVELFMTNKTQVLWNQVKQNKLKEASCSIDKTLYIQ